MTAASPRSAWSDRPELDRSLSDGVDGRVRFEPGSQAAYSTGGSNFRRWRGRASSVQPKRGCSAASLTGIGAFARATIGWFDRAKDYRRIEVGQQCEVLSPIGDIALHEGAAQVHAHVVLGLADGTVRGGHLLAGEVWPTLEVILTETPAHLRKTSRPDIGLALIDLDAPSP